MEEDGFVIVSKELMLEDENLSNSSARSSIFLVEDPSTDEVLLNGEKDEEESKAVEDFTAVEEGLAIEEAQDTSSKDLRPEEAHDVQEVEAVPKEQPKYVCSSCSLDVAVQADIVWEGYMGANKAAYLFGKVLNTEPAAEPRKQQLSTGMFLLQDVRCRSCSTPLGWSYLKAWNQEQRYKEGTTIIQQSLLELKGEPESSGEAALTCQ